MERANSQPEAKEKKYFFFDIDGTLTTKNPGGIVPESTLRTLAQLRRNGHFICIATGRGQAKALEYSRPLGIDLSLIHI